MNTDYFKDVPRQQYQALLDFQRLHPFKSLQVANDEWTYIDTGEGEQTIVLLVGGTRDAELAMPIIEALEIQYRVIVPNYPPAKELRTLEDGVAAILDQEGLHQVTLMGASFGGFVAQGFVRRYPQRVNKLILANTAGWFSPDYVKLVKRVLVMMRLMPMKLMRAGFQKKVIRHAVSFPESERDFWMAMLRQAIGRMDKATLLSQYTCSLDAHKRNFQAADLATWHGQILVIESSSDTAFPSEMPAAMHDLYPQAQFVNFPNAGHIPWANERAAYINTLQQFLSEEAAVLTAL